MDEQVRHLMRSLTNDLPRISTAPPGLLRRAHRRVALTVTGSVVVGAVVVVLVASTGIRALEQPQRRIPAHLTPTPTQRPASPIHLPARLAYTRDDQVMVTDLDGAPTRVRGRSLLEAWMPGGRSLLVGIWAGKLPAQLIQIDLDGTNEGAVPNAQITGSFSNALSPDRTQIAVARPSGLDIEQLDGSGARQVVSTASIAGGGGTIWYPAWSPDGTQIAFAWGGPKFGPHAEEEGLYTVNIDGSGLHRLAVAGTWPVWSPDGTQLIVQRGHSMRIMNADGTGARLLTSLKGHDPQPSWSPDGSMIAFNWSGDIYVIRPDGSGLVQVTSTPAQESGAMWQPQR